MKHLTKKILGSLAVMGLMGGAMTVVTGHVLIPVNIIGQSMYPTLNCGDSILLSGWVNEPELFDVIVFRAREDTNFVKRVIGTPGTHVAYRGDRLYIDGVAMEEDYMAEVREKVEASGRRLRENANFTSNFELEDICRLSGMEACDVIPDNYFLVLGDNRPGSEDSRHIGLVHRDQIMGRSTAIYWPVGRISFK